MNFCKYTLSFALVSALFLPSTVFAEPLSKDEIVQMCEKARAFFDENGVETTKNTFIDKNSGWFSPDYSINIQNVNTKILEISSTIPQFIGVDTSDIKGANGKEFVKEALAVKDTGWVEYKFPNKATNKIEDTIMYVVRDGDYIVTVSSIKK